MVTRIVYQVKDNSPGSKAEHRSAKRAAMDLLRDRARLLDPKHVIWCDRIVVGAPTLTDIVCLLLDGNKTAEQKRERIHERRGTWKGPHCRSCGTSTQFLWGDEPLYCRSCFDAGHT